MISKNTKLLAIAIGGITVTAVLLGILVPIFTVKSEQFFTGSVVEFEPEPVEMEDFLNNPFEYISSNIKKLKKNVKQAKNLGSDIIVFPEYGLTSVFASGMNRTFALKATQRLPHIIPESESLCDQEGLPKAQLHLKEISCAAREHKIYIVVNLMTSEICVGESCHDDGINFYNTNIAFDREGRIISRYRKFNPYLEELLAPMQKADVSYFDTDYGRRVGMMICFDIIYDQPLKQLIDAKVDDIAFSTAWFDETPFLSAMEYHPGIAMSSGLNILSSGYHFPKLGSTGSGIYSSKYGILDYTSYDKHKVITSKIYFGDSADVKTVKPTFTNEFHPIYFENLTGYDFKVLALGKHTYNIPANGTRCSLDYHLTINASEESKSGYVFVGKKGLRKFGGTYVAGIQACGIIFCHDTQDLMACGDPNQIQTSVSKNYLFENIHLKGIFEAEVFPAPVMLQSSFQPFIFNQSSVEYKSGQNGYHSLATHSDVSNLLTLGLYGRLYSMDEKK